MESVIRLHVSLAGPYGKDRQDVLREFSDVHWLMTSSSSVVHGLFIATIALRFVKPARLGGSAVRPHPLIFNTVDQSRPWTISYGGFQTVE